MTQQPKLILLIGFVMMSSISSVGATNQMSPVHATDGTGPNISVDDFEAPSEIPRDEAYKVQVELVNTGDAKTTHSITYAIKGGETWTEIKTKEVTLMPGEATSVTFDISVEYTREIHSSFDAGTHSHGILIQNTVLKQSQVTISAAQTTTSAPKDDADRAASAIEEAASALDRAQKQLNQTRETVETASANGAEVDDLEKRLEELQSELERANEEYQEATSARENGNYASAIDLANAATDRANTVEERAVEVAATAQQQSTASAGTRSPSEGEESRTETASTGGDFKEASSDQRQRGFFSNSGNEPDFLTNVFNLTTLGFLLSVAGIVHQMLGGG